MGADRARTPGADRGRGCCLRHAACRNRGWVYVAGAYLLQTFITGALEVNLAEEGAWGGLVQTRFADQHGLLGGALRTAPLFAAMHLPLQFTHGWTWGSVASGVVALP